MRHVVTAAVLLLALVLLGAGCGSEEPVSYGDEVSVEALEAEARPVTSVAGEEGRRRVTLEGTIGRVCESMGCWFYLGDADTMVLVDLEMGRRFTIPMDSEGCRAVVRGELVADGGDRRIVAESAVIWPR